MCTYASPRVKRVFIEKVNSKCFCWFPAAISVHQNGIPIWRLHTKLYKGGWNVSANNSETVGHKDLRPEQIVYILVFYNILFSLLLPLSLRTADAFPVVASLPPKNSGSQATSTGRFPIYFFVAWQWSSETCSQILRYCPILWGSNKNGVNPDRQGCCYPPADYWFQAIMEIKTERKSQWSNW